MRRLSLIVTPLRRDVLAARGMRSSGQMPTSTSVPPGRSMSMPCCGVSSAPAGSNGRSAPGTGHVDALLRRLKRAGGFERYVDAAAASQPHDLRHRIADADLHGVIRA